MTSPNGTGLMNVDRLVLKLLTIGLIAYVAVQHPAIETPLPAGLAAGTLLLAVLDRDRP